MHRNPLAIALSGGCIGWAPIRVIDGKRRTVPGALLYHLRDLRVGDFKAMLDGVAAAVQRALQTDAVVCVTCHFLSPSVSFIHNRLQLLDGQSWLRYQYPVFPEPRPMRHIDLDPISAVVELLASCLPCFDGTIDNLHSF